MKKILLTFIYLVFSVYVYGNSNEWTVIEHNFKKSFLINELCYDINNDGTTDFINEYIDFIPGKGIMVVIDYKYQNYFNNKLNIIFILNNGDKLKIEYNQCMLLYDKNANEFGAVNIFNNTILFTYTHLLNKLIFIFETSIPNIEKIEL